MQSNILTLDQQLKRLKVNSFEMDNQIVFEYFNKLPAEQRDEIFLRALYIGTLALMEDRLAAFLAKTQNELGTQLESLKMIFDMKKEIFFKTTVKGMVAEEDIADFLATHTKDRKLNDRIELTGTSEGEIPGNKTGDIVSYVDGENNKRIVVEVKFDKSMKLGDIQDKDIFTKKQDTAWSQLIEATANRNGKVGIIVFDKSLVDNSILKLSDSVSFIHSVGFIVVVDTQRGDYSNLAIAYNLARDIVLNAKELTFDDKLLTILLKRIIKDVESICNIKKLVEGNIRTNQEILKELEKAVLMMEFNEKYLSKFIKDGKLNHVDLLSFYSGDEIKDKYKMLSSDIEALHIV